MEYINKILCGRDMDILPQLPAESVNCVVTSPPYWGLRDYGIKSVIWDGDKDCKHDFGEYNSKLLHENRQNLDGGTLGNPKYRENLHGFGKAKAGFCIKCNAWRGSLGLEPTFELYIKHLCDIFDEVKRVLKKDGTCWVNLGDSYGGSGNASGHTEDTKNLGYKTSEMGATKGHTLGLMPKSLLLIPQRFAIEMVNRGWILRNTIIWHKPNCMPSSAKDRFTVDFEYIFFFTKSNKALFWTNEKTLECVSKSPPGTKGIEGKDWEWQKKESSWQRPSRDETFKLPSRQKSAYAKEGYKKVSLWTGHDYWFEQQFDLHTTKDDLDRRKNKYWSENIADGGSGKQNKGRDRREFYGKQGRNKRAVWTIPTSPFPEAHFAVYPEKLIEPMIQAGCPRYVCKKCGKARVKIYQETILSQRKPEMGKMANNLKGYGNTSLREGVKNKSRKEIGYTDCGCNAGFEPGVTLDPFIGAGTTAVVAKKLGRNYSGIEIKQEYIDMANKRIRKIPELLF